MTITIKRISLYLKQVKTLVNYHTKLRDRKDREVNLKVIEIAALLAEVESKLRDLQKYLLSKEENKNEGTQQPS
jgi:hypothetical protein